MDGVSGAVLEQARASVRELGVGYQLERRLERYRAHRWNGGAGHWPTLHLDDVSAIPFLIDIPGVEEYQHRARLRAGKGDLFAAVTPPTEGYETYCRERLGLGSVEFVRAEPVAGPLAVARACARGAALARLAAVAGRCGGLSIHPYMSHEAVWELAARVADAAGVAVEVIGPPPPVLWVANDKALFGEVVARVLGSDWLVDTLVGSSPRSLTDHLFTLSRRHPRVALKRLRCASGMGNLLLDARRFSRRGRAAIEDEVRDFLERTEWNGEEPVLAVAWEPAALSPSTQLWLPPAAFGPPRLEGIYEQILSGERGVFVGSRPSRLPAAVNRALSEAALRVAAGLQALGYVGRCSFDHLVVGDPRGEFGIRFTECNGRWGGTSTPMSLVDRLIGGRRPPYRAQDYAHRRLVDMSFGGLLSRLGRQAYDRTADEGRAILYNVGPLARFGKFDIIALGSSQEEAEQWVEEELPAVLGL